ncbi:hypothetical protein DIPPA_34384 [Diplonema papillatum]|nr:hypothetical protein DIPPA_34384 [Diplonema papillatum]
MVTEMQRNLLMISAAGAGLTLGCLQAKKRGRKRPQPPGVSVVWEAQTSMGMVRVSPDGLWLQDAWFEWAEVLSHKESAGRPPQVVVQFLRAPPVAVSFARQDDCSDFQRQLRTFLYPSIPYTIHCVFKDSDLQYFNAVTAVTDASPHNLRPYKLTNTRKTAEYDSEAVRRLVKTMVLAKGDVIAVLGDDCLVNTVFNHALQQFPDLKDAVKEERIPEDSHSQPLLADQLLSRASVGTVSAASDPSTPSNRSRASNQQQKAAGLQGSSAPKFAVIPPVSDADGGSNDGHRLRKCATATALGVYGVVQAAKVLVTGRACNVDVIKVTAIETEAISEGNGGELRNQKGGGVGTDPPGGATGRPELEGGGAQGSDEASSVDAKTLHNVGSPASQTQGQTDNSWVHASLDPADSTDQPQHLPSAVESYGPPPSTFLQTDQTLTTTVDCDSPLQDPPAQPVLSAHEGSDPASDPSIMPCLKPSASAAKDSSVDTEPQHLGEPVVKQAKPPVVLYGLASVMYGTSFGIAGSGTVSSWFLESRLGALARLVGIWIHCFVKAPRFSLALRQGAADEECIAREADEKEDDDFVYSGDVAYFAASSIGHVSATFVRTATAASPSDGLLHCQWLPVPSSPSLTWGLSLFGFLLSSFSSSPDPSRYAHLIHNTALTHVTVSNTDRRYPLYLDGVPFPSDSTSSAHVSYRIAALPSRITLVIP